MRTCLSCVASILLLGACSVENGDGLVTTESELHAPPLPVLCPQTLFVTTTSDLPGTCTPGSCSLRQAVRTANQCPGANEIRLPGGTFLLDQLGPESGYNVNFNDLDITGPVTITGKGIQKTIIAANGPFGIFEIHHDAEFTTRLSNLDLQYGNADGGAVRIPNGASVDIQQTAFRDNRAPEAGGAVLIENGSLTIDACQFEGNVAPRYGGGISARHSRVFVSRSEFRFNEAEYGAGLHAYEAHPSSGPQAPDADIQIRDSVFEQNRGFEPDSGFVFDISFTKALIQKSSLRNNQALPLWTMATDLELRDGEIVDNVAPYGAGAVELIGSPNRTALIENMRITGNRTLQYGPGGLSVNGHTTLRNSLVSDNHSAGGTRGGGIAFVGNFPFKMAIEGSTIANNTALGGGGGIYSGDMHGVLSMTIVNSTISGNQTVSDGGGIYSDKGKIRIKNSTIAGNIAKRGAAIYSTGESGWSLVELNHSIVSNFADQNNSTPLCLDEALPSGGSIASKGFNLRGDWSCALELPSDQLVADPGLTPLADHGGQTPTHDLLPTSPARDKGADHTGNFSDDGCAPLDQRGITRPQGLEKPRCDIGAVEVPVE